MSFSRAATNRVYSSLVTRLICRSFPSDFGQYLPCNVHRFHFFKSNGSLDFYLSSSSYRQFHVSSFLERKRKTTFNDSDDSEAEDDGTLGVIETLNADEMTPEEVEALVASELAKMEENRKKIFRDDWKPGMKKRYTVVSNRLEDFLYELAPETIEPLWTRRDRRCGALAIKVGMLPVFDDWGIRHPCTVLFLDNNIVMSHKTLDEDGYLAVRIAAGQRKRKNVGKTVLGQYKAILKEDEHPPFVVREFRVSEESHLVPLYSQIHARHFCPGQNIDVSGISKGKGFQGAMKRHNFSGMPASHGTSLSHRHLGSTGQCQDPGRVFKGKKMAGHMGAERVTVQNLRIVKIDRGRNLLYVEGAVPGNKGAFVEVRDAIKKPLWRTDKVLGAITRPPVPTFNYDETIDGCGQTFEEYMPLQEIDPFMPDLDDEAVKAAKKATS